MQLQEYIVSFCYEFLYENLQNIKRQIPNKVSAFLLKNGT